MLFDIEAGNLSANQVRRWEQWGLLGEEA